MDRLAQAKYIPRLYANYFNLGIPRTFVFSFYNQTNQGADLYGTQAGAAVKNMISVLNDSAWNPSTLSRTGTPFEAGWLDYAISASGGCATKINHLLLQKSSGDFYLLLWQDVSVYNKPTLSDIVNAPVASTLALQTPVSSAVVWTQNNDGSYTQSAAAVSGSPGAQTVSINIPDTITIVRLTPSNGLSGTQQGPNYTTLQAAVNSGGSAAGSFVGDTGYYGGQTYSSTDAINTSAVSSPAPQAVYDSERYGFVSYMASNWANYYGGWGMPYKMRLHFAENRYVTQPGVRTFDAYVNGISTLTGFDIFAAAGNQNNKAVVAETYGFADSDGLLLTGLLGRAGDAKINGIEIDTDGSVSTRDDLNDFSQIYSRTANWTFDTSNAQFYFAGDTSRAIRSTNTTESITWRRTGLRSFDAFSWGNEDQVRNYVRFYVSPDGVNWTPIPHRLDEYRQSDVWYGWNVHPNTSLPSGTNYVKLEIQAGTSANWGVQIGSMTLTYNNQSRLTVGPTGSTFRTGFENGQPQPSWSDTIDFSNNVSGYFSNIRPECSPRSGEQTHTGGVAEMYSGTANGTSNCNCYYKVFDFSSSPLTIGSTTSFSYWIYPQFDNARYVAVDFLCSDGTTLRDSAAKDQNGYRMHPAAGHGGNIPLNSWSYVTSNIGFLNGKKVVKMWVAFDRANATGQYHGYIDDIALVP